MPEVVFASTLPEKFNYKQLAAQLGYKPAMVKAKIEMALSDMERRKYHHARPRRYKLKYNAIYTEGVRHGEQRMPMVSPDTERDILIVQQT